MSAPLGRSPEDLARSEEVQRLAALGVRGVAPLVAMLAEPSWVVRRAIVSFLAAMGRDAIPYLVAALRDDRKNEARVAGIVDALSETHAIADVAVRGLIPGGAPAVVADAAQILGRRRTTGAVGLLAELTRHADDNVAVAAVEALGRIGGAAAMDPLLQMLDGKNFFRTCPAIEVLGRSGDARAVEPLIALVSNATYAPQAVRMLGRLGDERAAPVLVRMLAVGEGMVQVSAVALMEVHARCCVRYGGAKSIENLPGASPEIATLVRRLANALTTADATERRAIASILGWLDRPDAVAILMTLLEDDDARAAAVQSLRRLSQSAESEVRAGVRSGPSHRRRLLLPLLSGRAGVEDVGGCLADEDPMVRALAANTLARSGDAAALPMLFAHLGDPDMRVANAVLGAVQSLGHAQTERLTLEAARSKNDVARRSALRIIGYFGYLSGLELLLETLGGADVKAVEIALQSLSFLDDPRALAALLTACAHPTHRTRAAATRALGNVARAANVTATLVAALADPDPWVRYYACQSLGKLRDESATDAIVACLKDDAGQVRIGVIDALSHFRGPTAQRELRAAARSTDSDLRHAALLGLGVAKQVEGLPLIHDALRADDAATRLVAVSAVAEFEDEESLSALALAAVDPDAAVADAAMSFLRERDGAAATRTLIQLLDSTVAEKAAEALSVPVEARIPEIVAALVRVPEIVIPRLIAALARMAKPEAESAITQAFSSERVEVRRAAASAMIVIGAARFSALLTNAAECDRDPEVRRICEAARLR